VAFIVSMLLLAIFAYTRKNNKLPNRKAIIFILSMKIIILVGLMAVDFVTQYIYAFFLLGIGSCFCTFIVL